MLYFEDGDNVRRNRVTIINSGGPSYNAVLSATFSAEASSLLYVSLAQAKKWCYVDNGDFDEEITELIYSAREIVEKQLNKSLITRTVTATIINDLGGQDLPYGPVIGEITSVTDDYETPVEDYNLNRPLQSGVLTFVYHAGYEVATLPSRYKTMWKNKIVELFDRRGNVS